MNTVYYVEDVARILGVDKNKAADIMTSADFPSEKDGSLLRVAVGDFDAWLKKFANSHHSYAIELVTAKDVADFVNAIESVEADVRIKGKDENGYDWETSAKSMLLTLCAAARGQFAQTRKQQGKDSAQDVDWGTLRCECSLDIYSKIQPWIKGGILE